MPSITKFSVSLIACGLFIQPLYAQTSTVSLPVYQGFESVGPTMTYHSQANAIINGLPGWRHDANLDERLQFNRGNAYKGSKAASLDRGNLDENKLIMTLDASAFNTANHDLRLSYAHNNAGDADNASSGVFVRGSDTDAWLLLSDWNDGNVNQWREERHINISSRLSTGSQSFSNSTQIMFVQHGDAAFNDGGAEFDDIAIELFNPSSSASSKPNDLVANMVDFNNQIMINNGIVRYRVTLINPATGSDAVDNVVFSIANFSTATALINDSITTTQGTITSGNTSGDTMLTVNVGTIANDSAAVIDFSVRTSYNNSETFSNQGAVSATGISQFFTDDPRVNNTSSDATVTTFGNILNDFALSQSPLRYNQTQALQITKGNSSEDVVFASTTPATCSIVNTNQVRGLALGTCTLTANQAGDAILGAADEVTLTTTVEQGTQQIFNFALNRSHDGLTAGSTATVSAGGGNSGNPVIFSTDSASCSVTDSLVSFTAAGSCNIKANQAGNTNYLDAPEATLRLTVGGGSSGSSSSSSSSGYTSWLVLLLLGLGTCLRRK